MGRTKSQGKKTSKAREKTVLGVGKSISKRKMSEDAGVLLQRATVLLQTGELSEALSVAQQALQLVSSSSDSPEQSLSALNLVGEISVELGEIDSARGYFLRAAELDPHGTIPENQGGGAEKFLWLAQLSSVGGADSVRWFERGIVVLRQTVQSLEERADPEHASMADEKKRKLSNALCAVAEIYMTDLSWEEDAESRCEALITEALLFSPNSPEVLQTLASIRISQLRTDEARAALTRSMELWKDLPPEDANVPDFAIRISLSRLLMEVDMELEALEVLERLILEDDQSVEGWYLGGWCLYLLARKPEPPATSAEADAQDSAESKRHASLVASREWLSESLRLYDLLQYEDERLRDHAKELVQDMNQELGDEMEDDEEEEGCDNDDEEETGEGDGEWANEIEVCSDEDDEMADS